MQPKKREPSLVYGAPFSLHAKVVESERGRGFFRKAPRRLTVHGLGHQRKILLFARLVTKWAEKSIFSAMPHRL